MEKKIYIYAGNIERGYFSTAKNVYEYAKELGNQMPKFSKFSQWMKSDRYYELNNGAGFITIAILNPTIEPF